MAMEDLGGEMGSLSGEMEDSITDPNQKDTKTKIDNTKSEDLDGLQMLRLPQEEDKNLLRKDILPIVYDESIDQPTLFKDPVDDEVKYFPVSKPVIREDDSPLEKPKVDIVAEEEVKKENLKPNIEQDVSNRRIALKHKGVEGALVKPALVKKEVREIHARLTEGQEKILQDFHVKFVLEGVNVDEDDESRARKHSEFVELKKRLEEEEKMYAGCALGEASAILDGSDIKDQQMEQGKTIVDSYDGGKDVDQGATVLPRNVAALLNVANENIIDSSSGAVRATMEGVINSLAEVSICTSSDSRLEEDVKSQLQPPNVRNAMKDLAYDDEGLSSELQEYTYREGSTGCQCCCRKAGKQIDEGDESDVYMTHSSYSMLNVVCPVSGIPVVDLEDPVRSEECEHIYDRASALNFISSMAKDGFCLCASPGCRALLAENKLVTDSRLWQDIEELRQIKAMMWESRMLHDLVNIDDSDDD